MVYQENTHVIVMTTKEVERGRVRAAAKPQYHLHPVPTWEAGGKPVPKPSEVKGWVVV